MNQEMFAFRVSENPIKSHLNAHSVSRATSYDVTIDRAFGFSTYHMTL